MQSVDNRVTLAFEKIAIGEANFVSQSGISERMREECESWFARSEARVEEVLR